jgi:hypothetical protein
VTVSFGAIGAKTITGTATVDVAYPASPAAGDIAVLCRAGYPAAITFTDEAGWTNITSADLSGGNNGAVADDHTTHVHADYQVLVGGESGTVTFDQGGTAGGVVGVMARYASDVASHGWVLDSGTGTDDTHGADRSITTSGNVSLAPGDMVLAIAAVDTDSSLTITSPTFTSTGITFGSVTRRTSGAGSIAGQDGNVELFDALVTAGTGTGTVTFAFTTATSQCGPIAIVRLRETAPALTGTASLTETATITADGRAEGTAALTATATISASGSLGSLSGSASLAASAAITAAGRAQGGASLTGTAAITAAGSMSAQGGASLSIGVSIHAAGGIPGLETAITRISTGSRRQRATSGNRRQRVTTEIG